jgi:hypothetical protein
MLGGFSVETQGFRPRVIKRIFIRAGIQLRLMSPSLALKQWDTALENELWTYWRIGLEP